MMNASAKILTDLEIEQMARDMGMVYRNELKITDFYEEDAND